jgi:DNA-binding MarR family transcriptional regulator
MARKDTPDAAIDGVIETAVYLQSESRRLARQQCEALGVTATQLNVLKLLLEVGQLSLTELSRRLASQNSTVTGIADRLEAGGLVVRERDPDDRRVWRVRLTDKGRSIAARAELTPWTLLRRAIDALPARERKTLLGLLDQVAAHVRAELQGEAHETGK